MISANYKNQSSIEFRFFNSNEFLPNNFDPTGINPESPLLGGNTYQSRFIQLGYNSDPSRRFYYSTSHNYGKFYNGRKYTFDNNLFYDLNQT